MISALSSALGGLHAASALLEQAAGAIVRAGAQPVVPEDAAPSAIPDDRPLDRAPAGGMADELAGAIVDLRAGVFAYEASAAVVRTEDRMQAALLDIRS